MAFNRYYYSDKIEDFLQRSDKEIIADLTTSHVSTKKDVNDVTIMSWEKEIPCMKKALSPYAQRGSVFFEYNIPRMGRRVDVIVIIDHIVFVLEFKTNDKTTKFNRAGFLQVWDYALDLKNFQEGSLDRTLVPVLVSFNATDKDCCFDLHPYQDDVYTPLLTNDTRLPEAFERVLNSISPATFVAQEDELWARSGYSPTPTIIEAAIALYRYHSVAEITRHDADLDKTCESIDAIIQDCKSNHKKAICFITGVPGAGKTLIGLQTAIDQFNKDEKAVYLSGNFPLVEVLQEALTRDYVAHKKEKGERVKKEEAKSKVKTFIQMVHHYRDHYLESVKVVDGKIVPDFKKITSLEDKAYVPVENVVIFDEAQRAWTKQELARFMKEKKGYQDFPYSEPEYLISCMDRHQDWAVILCLIGGGQEINKGEAGLQEWIESINRTFQHWNIYISDKLLEQEYAHGNALSMIQCQENVHIDPYMHLPMSMRSFRAEKLSYFVHQLLELNIPEAQATLRELKNYPIVLTRSLDKAKEWLRSKARGTERYGLLASSKAERLKAISVNVRYQPDFVHWFLEDDTDIRSSNRLEDTLTEFKVQGLEIDWSCVIWDADLRLNSDFSEWGHFQLRSGTKWQNINKPINREYQINAYRVLLTRARQGMVIVVPEGDDGSLKDDTRKPIWYDNTYNYLRKLGIPTI